ncbi:MAG: hypothetical protein WCL51_14920, partial [Bacteroidota bacterium]
MRINKYFRVKLHGFWVKTILKSLLIIVLFQQCSSHTGVKKDAIFDSLLVNAKHKLKSNADSALIATKNLSDYVSIKNDANQMFDA